MKANQIAICSLLEVEEVSASFGATHLLSLLEPGRKIGRPESIAKANHLTLWFQDTWDPNLLLAPTIEHIERIDGWVDNQPADARLLVHCFAGVSRSPGAALGILAKSMPPEKAVEALFKLRPEAVPNALVVRLWDRRLGLEGTLLGSLQETLGFDLDN